MANNDDVSGEPLPADFSHTVPAILDAHNKCLAVERNLLDVLSNEISSTARIAVKRNLINVRILGHFLTVAPSDSAKRHVALSIMSCESDEDLFFLGEFYDKHFIRTFRRAKDPTPAASRHPSRPSFNRIEEMIRQELVSTPANHQQAKKNALIRDSYRCMLSGAYDHSSVFSIKELEEQMERAVPAVEIVFTQCAHIFSESTTTNLDNADKLQYAANAWAIIEAFGYPGIRDELSGAKLHSLQNILTLDTNLHTMFDDLMLWLEATDTPNCYSVKTTRPLVLTRRLNPVPDFVTFTSSDPELPLPSSTYLGIHAACCRVAHMSGAAAYFDKLLNRDDDYALRDAEQFAVTLAARLYDIQS